MLLTKLNASLLGLHPADIDSSAFKLLAFDEVGEAGLVGLRVITMRGTELERAVDGVEIGLEDC